MVKTVAVVGAGPAGLTAAYCLARQGIHVEVFEANTEVGGMSRSVTLWGQRVDVGPHRFFSTDPRVNSLWLEIMGRDYVMVNRLSRIYYNKTFFHYPLRPLNALAGLGIVEAVSCVLSYARARLVPPKDLSTFEGWVVSRFGRRLFSIFFKSYSEKLWGIPCDALDSEFAAQRIKKFSLSEAIASAFRRKRDRRHKTLADEFAYPRAGSGQFYERMADRFRAAGGLLHLQTPVAAVEPHAEGAVVRLPDGKERQFDHVISTMPITRLVEQMKAPDAIRAHAKALTFRNTILVYVRVASAQLFADQWIYIHSPELLSGRITNFSNWRSAGDAKPPETILCLEYWCNETDDMWRRSDAELISLARADLTGSGLVPPDKIKDGHVIRVPRCYPVYARGYRRHLKPVEEFLSLHAGITAIGRYGAFKYNNQDHSILMGLLAAGNLTGQPKHDLWSINTDYEYQESSRITETGLVYDEAPAP